MSEEKEKPLAKALRVANELKMVAGALLLLPLFGSQLDSIFAWGKTIVNINERLDAMATKEESVQIAIDALLYIDSAIQDEITALEFAEESQIIIFGENPRPSKEELDSYSEMIEQIRDQRRFKILEQRRIRDRIKMIDPNWKDPDE